LIKIKFAIPKKKVSFWIALLISLSAGTALYFALYQLYMPVNVVEPNKIIDARTVITDKDVEQKSVRRTDKHPKAFSNPQEVIGKYADARLYPGEQIIADRITSNPGIISGAFSYLAPDETYVDFTSNEARWPKGLKVGDTVTVAAFIDGQEIKAAEKLKVIGVDDKGPAGVTAQVQQAVSNDPNKITLAIKFEKVGALLGCKAKTKEMRLLPEHPNREGGDIYEQQPVQPETASKGSKGGSKG